MKSKFFIFICFLTPLIQLYAQSIEPDIFLYKRTSDIMRDNAAVYPLWGISKFVQNLNVNAYDDWRSVSSIVSLNGIPYNTLPLNYNSPDLVPVDLLGIDSILLYIEPDIRGIASSSSGGINLISREISDTFLIRMRAFTGSETGDPLIYRFTRREIPIVNKNKIVPSAVISIEGNSRLRYRISGGYFGYFAFNSSENSSILNNLSDQLTRRQNRKILGSAELQYTLPEGRQITLFSSILHFYGWELPPFITSFVHLRSYTFANRLKLRNIFKDFTAGLKYDGNISRIREMDLTPSGKFMISDLSLFTEWNSESNSEIIFQLFTEAGRYSAANLQSGTVYSQNLFNKNRSYYYYNINAKMDFLISEKFQLTSSNRFEKNILPQFSYSGSLKFLYRLNPEHHFSILGSSISSFPDIFETNGRFSTLRQVYENSLLDTFSISGNSNISYERVNSLYAAYNYSTKKADVNLNTFLRNVQNQISMIDTDVMSTFYPGDIIRNSVYYNAADKTYLGINSSFKYRFSLVDLFLSHSGIFTKNRFPLNIVVLSAHVNVSRRGSFFVDYLYSSARYFKEFNTDNPGAFIFTSKTPQINLFSLSYTHRIPGLYYFRYISASIKIDNLFNKRIKFHPMGNNMDRTIEFYLSLYI